MSNNLTQAIDAALAYLKAKKLCYACEDDDSYFLTACGENGEPIYAPACCRVDKKTLSVSSVYHTDPDFNAPVRELEFPEERMNIYIPLEKVLGYGG